MKKYIIYEGSVCQKEDQNCRKEFLQERLRYSELALKCARTFESKDFFSKSVEALKRRMK